MKKLIQKVCFAIMLVMLSLTVCTSALAESMDDVLKDCKLDRSRWKVVEWFKAEQFVRFYDSTSVTVTGPGRFDAVIYDYYYGNNTCISDCKLQGKKHYHSEKWGFNTTKSAGTLRSMATKDLVENVVTSYDVPSNMQIEIKLNKKSFEYITMQKIKASLKDDKKFTAEPKATSVNKDPAPQPKITGLVPMPMAIGASDGEWTYMGRYIAPSNFSSPLEWQTRMTQYTGSSEANNLYDAYFYHSHYGDGDGQGCPKGNIGAYKCVLKFVPLDRNGRPEKISGGPHGTYLLSMTGATKGVFAAIITRVRVFDSVTHQQLINTTDEIKINKSGKNGYTDADYYLMKVRHNAPYYKAMQMTGCHYAWQIRAS